MASGTAATGDPAALASSAMDMASVDAAQATAMAQQALDLARSTGDPGHRSLAEQALGVAARHEHRIPQALEHLRRAVDVADAAGLHYRGAQARVPLMAALALGGATADAVAEGERAARILRGKDRAVLELQRATVHYVSGQFQEALHAYRRALPLMRRAGDRANEARVLGNRASVHFHMGDLRAAEADYTSAERLHTELGLDRMAATVRANLGCLAARRGDIPSALMWFERADAYAREHGTLDPVALTDRCEALMTARLLGEARATAARAVSELTASGDELHLAEARLTLAEAALLQGDFDVARTQADEARRAFARQRRESYVALARSASVRAAWMAGDRSLRLLREARQAAAALAEAGWVVPALDARLIAAEVAIARSKIDVAREVLARTATVRRAAPVELRSRAAYAEALLRLAASDRRGAEAALRAGIRMVEIHRAALGATELRARASAHAARLADLGLRLAMDDGNAARVLAWAERWRASTLDVRPTRPPADAALRREIDELRAVVREAGQAATEGRPTATLLARQSALEQAVTRRARRARGTGLYLARPAPTVTELRAALDGRALVEIVERGGWFHAVVVAGGPPRLFRLAPADEVSSEVAKLRFTLRRLTSARSAPVVMAAARDALAFGAKVLDGQLLEPVAAAVGNRDLVIVPTGVLHHLPWLVLPSCAGKAVSVAPSAALWHAATMAPRGRAKVRDIVLVAGPDLPAGAEEVAALCAAYPSAECLNGDGATVAAVTAALDGAGLVHIAAHGQFRSDNPLFSSLRCADGPLTVHDLETLRRAPEQIVLSSCDVGLSEVCAGDELIGLAAALFSLGARTLVASVLPVHDAATQPFMLAFHEALRAGAGPASALATAQRSASGDAETAVASTFVCYGAG